MKWPALVFSKDLNPITIASVGRDLVTIVSLGLIVSYSWKSTVVLLNRQGIAILVTLYN